MAAVLAGEAAVRIVPTLRNFHPEVRRKLKEVPHHIDVAVRADLEKARAELDKFRAEQRLNAVNVPIRADYKTFQRDLSQVEHIFKRSSVAKAIRVSVVVAGLDALPALAYAAGSATAAVDALGKAAFALPGLLGGALSSAGALAVGLHGVSDALKAYAQDSDKASDNARKQQDADRELTSAKRNLQNAIRDQKREIEDLNQEMRRSSLSEADAILSIQEDVDRLRKGGFKSLTEYQRAQLQLAQDTDHLTEVQTKNNRTIEDANKANAEGVLQSDKVSDALDRVAKATEAIDHSNVSKVNDALAKLSPNAQATVQALHELQGEWTKLVQTPTQDALFAGMDKSLTDLAHKTLPMLGTGLSGVATGLNTNLKAISSSLGADKNSSLLTRIFGNTQGGLNNASKGMDSLIHGILLLTSSSSNFLPRLGDAADKVFAKFDTFINRISEDGSMERWIDKGLKAVDALGRTAGSVGSIISSISQAFDIASGHTGGFISTLDGAAKKLADFLKSTDGQNSLVGYFKQAKEFTSGLGEAFKNIRPFLHDLIQAARDFSSFILPLVGDLAKMASWIERNTGLVKPLLEAYLGFRLVHPIIEGLTGAWSNYAKVMEAVARQGGVGGAVQNGFNEMKSKMYALGQTAETTAPKVDAGKRALEQYQIATGGATKSSLAGKDALAAYQGAVKGAGNEAGIAAGKVDGKEGSLGGALKNLGKFIGPTLAFTAAIVTVTTLIQKLGESHRNAAADADRQRQALDGLKQSVDSVSGAAGKAALAQTAKANQKFPVPGLGDRNVNQDIARIGLGDAGTLLDAQTPINQGKRDELQGKLNEATKAKVASSSQWRDYHAIWEGNGVDLDTISLAMNGNQDALNKVHDAEKKMFGKPRDQLGSAPGFEWARIHAGVAAPSLTELTKNSGAYESVSVSAALQGGERSLREGGQLAREANDAVNKKGKFKGDAAAFWAQYGSDESKISIGPDGNAVILSDRKPPLNSETGTTVENSPGQFQTTLTTEATNRYIEKYAKGGLVRGVGGPTDDLNLAAMSPGEHVTKAKAVDYYGASFFNALNNMQIPRHSGGGWGGIPLDPAPPSPRPDPGSVILPGSTAAPFNPNTFLSPGAPPHPGLGSLLLPGSTRTPFDPSPFITPGGSGSPLTVAPTGPLPALIPQGLPPVTPGAKPPAVGTPRPGATDLHGWFGSRSSGVNEAIGAVTSIYGSAPPVVTPSPAPAPKPSSGVKPWEAGEYAPPGYHHEPMPGHPGSFTLVKDGAAPLGGPQTHGSGGPPGPRLSPGSTLVPLGDVPGWQAPRLPGTGGGNVPLSTAGAPGVIYPPTAGIPGMPLTGSRFPGTEKGLQINTLKALQAISAAFPEISDIGGVRPDKLHWHPDGLALDIMIPGQGGLNDPTTPEGLALGNRIWAWMGQNAEALGIDMNASLWQQPDHHNHIHLASTGGGYPTGTEQFTMPGAPGAGGLTSGGGGAAGILGALGIPALGGAGGSAGGPAFLQPENIMNFLAGQASSVGSGISQIGLGLFQGATGLNLSPLLSAGQELGNGAISALGGLGGSGGDGTELNAAAADDISRFYNGQLPLGASGAGGVGSPYSPSGGAEQWRPLVRKVLQQVGPKYGITNTKAWEDAIIKQIGSESGGNPNSTNDHDSNGRGGTQSVGGILNFLPATFSANNITGGSFMDPQAQIAAAIPYVVKKFGMNPDGSPKGIGQGHGFKSGGFPPGSAMVSSGEFITNNRATSFYGPALFNALNSMSIPKKSIGGFKNGGFPRGIPGFEDGGYPVPPVDFGQPPPDFGPPPPITPQPPQTPGPLQLGQPSMEAPASTGGPPGPGATAPAPDPGGLPQVADALAGLGGGAPGQSDLPQPGVDDGKNADDARATLGARPASMEHTAPALKQGIEGAASTIGSIASMAASMAINGAAPGAGSAAGAGIQAGAQMAGAIATGAVNILSSLMVGSATPGSTAQASGIPLLPQRQPMQTGVPAVNQRIHNGPINITNLDEYKRQQELMDAQNAMPRIGQYG